LPRVVSSCIEERDQEAWTGIHNQYQRLVAKWVNGPPDQSDERINEAFAKFWTTIAPKSFTHKFAGIGKVMAYLQSCARSVGIDIHRREEKHKHLVALGDCDDETKEQAEALAVAAPETNETPHHQHFG
jgi:DNA-directed RNA polymerase specialized sigma24 family protein